MDICPETPPKYVTKSEIFPKWVSNLSASP